MAEQLMTDQVGVRFGIAGGVLFVLTDVVAAGGVPGQYGVGVLLVATAVLALVLDGPHAVLLGLAGWALATGFAVNTLGVLTFEPTDLLRLAAFVLAATASGRLGPTR